MKEKTKAIIEIILGVFGCCLAVFTLFFGDNLHQQITGRNIFQNPSGLVTQTPTNTTLPAEITDAKGVTMRLVPAGEFTMGSDNGGFEEKPVHQVYLYTFYMDIYEVTNAAYKACVDDGTCSTPGNTDQYNNSMYEHHPVVHVDWNQANAYCEWRGASLPTEAQWEKAARGTDGRTYPWGEGIDCDRANYSGCAGDPTEVGSYESGKSPYGIYDMAGNVWEWVYDWYDDNYYQSSPFSNPIGPSSGHGRMLRGGAWYSVYKDVRSTVRAFSVGIVDYNIGFRCALSRP